MGTTLHSSWQNQDICKAVGQKALIDGGTKQLGDVLDYHGNFLAWENIQSRVVGATIERAYLKLFANIDLAEATVKNVGDKKRIFLHLSPLQNDCTLWEFEVPPRMLADSLRFWPEFWGPTSCFPAENGALTSTLYGPPAPDSLLRHAIVGLPRSAPKGAATLSHWEDWRQHFFNWAVWMEEWKRNLSSEH